MSTDQASQSGSDVQRRYREFLDLLGIPAFYALLSYRYSIEHNEPDLATHNINFQHHLRFEANP